MALVLVIDDDNAMRDIIRLALETQKHAVIEATDWPNGLSAFRRDRPALVITDIQLPGVNGLDAIRELRQIDADVPIIAISGELATSESSALKRAERLGATATLEKPFRRQQLIDLVAATLSPPD